VKVLAVEDQPVARRVWRQAPGKLGRKLPEADISYSLRLGYFQRGVLPERVKLTETNHGRDTT